MPLPDTDTPRPDVPWSAVDAWLGAGCLGIWMLVSFMMVAILKNKHLQINPGLVISVLELVLLIPVWWFTFRKYRATWADLGLVRFKARFLGLGLGLMIPALWFNALYSSVLARYGLEVNLEMERVFAQTSSPWLLVGAAVILAPLVEEIFFRGFVFSGLRRRYGWKPAMFLSAGLFALLHLRPLAAPPIFILGLLFAYLYQRSRSIWPAICVHLGVNSLAVVWVFSR